MTRSNGKQGYSRLAKLLHWATALIIFGMIPLGLYMVSLAPSPFKFDLYYYHKSFGLLVLLLVLLRLGWRFYASPPAPLTSYALWELYLSRLVHIALYGLLLGLPVSGWLMSSAGDFPVIVFGLQIPHLIGENEALFNTLRAVHYYAAFVIAGLVFLHIVGAIKHHFADKDITLQRMLPARGGMVLLGAVLVAVLGTYSSAGYLLLYDAAAKDKAQTNSSSEQSSAATANKTASKPGVQDGPEADLPQWKLLTGRSEITFTAYQQGSPITGHFGEFTGQIAFDPERPADSRAGIEIALISAQTGSKDRDERLKSGTWFNISQYPKARYVIDSFEARKGEGNYIARGRLHLRGERAPVDLPFHLDINRNDKGQEIARAKGQAQLKRLNYGVGQGKWQDTGTIANKVDIEIDIYALRQ